MKRKLIKLIAEIRDPENQDAVFLAYIFGTAAYMVGLIPLVGR